MKPWESRDMGALPNRNVADVPVLSGATQLPDQFVASFGKDAALGCFTAAGPMTLARRQRVLLKTPRGLEVGEIMGPATLRQARLLGANVQGDLIRTLTREDDAIVRQTSILAANVLTAAEDVLRENDMTLSLIDAEAFFDLRHALVHVLHPRPDELAAFVDAVSARTGLTVRLANLAIPAEDHSHGCGEPDCGGGNCSTCSTGGCSTGCGTGSTAAPDLRPYFAHLREKMETNQRVPLV